MQTIVQNAPRVEAAPTKEQELRILREAAAQLGPKSYLGPWLEEIACELESLVRCDVFPRLSLRSAADYCAQLERDATDKARHLVSQADAYAKAKADTAAKQADGVRASLMSAIRTAEHALLRS